MISTDSNNEKPQSNVLRPSAGISSNIFGNETVETPRVVKNHMASNILAAGKESNSVKNNGEQPRRGQKNVDSYTRLFGEPDRPFTPAKNYLKSNLPFGPNAEVAKHFLANANGHNSHTKGKGGSVSTSASSSVTSSTENLKINSVSKTDGTPITGDNSMANNGAQVIMKNRVPPGGFSSGLW